MTPRKHIHTLIGCGHGVTGHNTGNKLNARGVRDMLAQAGYNNIAGGLHWTDGEKALQVLVQTVWHNIDGTVDFGTMPNHFAAFKYPQFINKQGLHQLILVESYVGQIFNYFFVGV